MGITTERKKKGGTAKKFPALLSSGQEKTVRTEGWEHESKNARVGQNED